MLNTKNDTREVHGGALMTCYCDECCDTARDWFTWRDPTGSVASGARYWTRDAALADRVLAAEDGLTELWHDFKGRDHRVDP